MHVADYFCPDFNSSVQCLPKKHFLSLRMDQNAPPGMQILKVSQGTPPRPPLQEGIPLSCTLPSVAFLCRNKAPATLIAPPNIFFQIENPVLTVQFCNSYTNIWFGVNKT